MIRVLIADDHPVVRAGLAAMVDSVPDLVVAGQVATPGHVVTAVDEFRVDVVLLDLSFGKDGSGVEALHDLRNHGSTVPVLIVTSFESERDILAAIEAGAAGYLLKDAEPDALVAGIRAAAAGEMALAPRVAQRMAQRLRSPHEALTSRELEVLHLVASGASNSQIANTLVVSEATVKSHLTHVFTKLDVSSRTEAVHQARQRGLMP
ncbi:response regulator transcription factor [Demequina sp. B12]|uniref:response regulator n=1 Tax=Demequina sp. B12 TaxID=2992757 RepID=UPI00237C1282|nr:response regulator transcription factor [Demequina sp. B12]MDE0572211.1 response regulator transcription factor [Demequina sp. B12]